MRQKLKRRLCNFLSFFLCFFVFKQALYTTNIFKHKPLLNEKMSKMILSIFFATSFVLVFFFSIVTSYRYECECMRACMLCVFHSAHIKRMTEYDVVMFCMYAQWVSFHVESKASQSLSCCWTFRVKVWWWWWWLWWMMAMILMMMTTTTLDCEAQNLTFHS